jgi:hypothetical protein
MEYGNISRSFPAGDKGKTMTIKHKTAIAALLLATSPVASTLHPARAEGTAPPTGTALSMNGAVGLPLNPTALLPPAGRTPVQLEYFDLGDVETDGVRPSTFQMYGLHAATRLGRSPLELNVGLESLDAERVDSLQSNRADRSGAALGLKYPFFANRSGDTALAVGAGYSRVLAKNLYAYLVGTRAFRRGLNRAPILAHLGVRYDRFDVNDVAAFADDSHRASVFGGLEVPIDRYGQWTAVGELQSKNNDYRRSYFSDVNSGEARAPYSVGLRYRTLDERFSATAGVQRRGYPGLTNDNGLFAQVGYAFGEARETVRTPLTIVAPVDIEGCASDDVSAKVRMQRPAVSGGLAPYSWDAARSDGLNWADPYAPGVTTIEWRATDSAGDTVTAKSTVTVVGVEITDLVRRPFLVPYQQNSLALSRDELIRAGTGFPKSQLTYSLERNGAEVDADKIVLDFSDLPASQSRTFDLDWTVGLAGADCSATYRQTLTVEKTAAPPPPITDVKIITFDATACAHGDADTATVTIEPARTNPADVPLSWQRSDGGQSLSTPYPLGRTSITWTAKAFGKTFTATSAVTINKLELTEPVNLTYSLDWPATTYARAPMAPIATWVTPAGRTPVAVRASLRDGSALPADAPYDFPIGSTLVTWTATQTMDGHTCQESATQLITVNRAPLRIVCPDDVEGWMCEGDRAELPLEQPRAADNRPLKITAKRSDDADGSKGLQWDSPYPIGATIVKWYVADGSEPGGMIHECKTVVRVRGMKLRWASTPRNITRTVFECQKLRLSAAAIGQPIAVTNYPSESTPVRAVGRINGRQLGASYDFPCGKTTVIHWTATNALGCSIEWNQKVRVVAKSCHGKPMPHIVAETSPAQNDFYDK